MPHGEYVFEKNEHGEKFYVVVRGKVAVLAPIKKDDEEYEQMTLRKQQYEHEKQNRHRVIHHTEQQKLQRLYDKCNSKEIRVVGEGHGFGEIALAKGVNLRNASVLAVQDCEFATLSKENYLAIFGDSEEQQMQDRAYFLKQVGIFQQWGIYQLRKLANFFQQEHFEKSQFAFREGDPAHEVYLVYEGEFTLKKQIRTAEHADSEYQIVRQKSAVEDLVITHLLPGEVGSLSPQRILPRARAGVLRSIISSRISRHSFPIYLYISFYIYRFRLQIFGEEEFFKLATTRQFSVQLRSLKGSILRISKHDILHRFVDQRSIQVFRQLARDKRLWRLQRFRDLLLLRTVSENEGRDEKDFREYRFTVEGSEQSNRAMYAEYLEERKRSRKFVDLQHIRVDKFRDVVPGSVLMNQKMLYYLQNHSKPVQHEFLDDFEKNHKETMRKVYDASSPQQKSWFDSEKIAKLKQETRFQPPDDKRTAQTERSLGPAESKLAPATEEVTTTGSGRPRPRTHLTYSHQKSASAALRLQTDSSQPKTSPIPGLDLQSPIFRNLYSENFTSERTTTLNSPVFSALTTLRAQTEDTELPERGAPKTERASGPQQLTTEQPRGPLSKKPGHGVSELRITTEDQRATTED